MNRLFKLFLIGFPWMALIAFLLSSCEPGGEPVQKTFDRTGKEVTVTIELFANEDAVNEKYSELHGVSYIKLPPRTGFAQWEEPTNPEEDLEGELICKIYNIEPKRVDDEATLSLGHELLHCIYGSYHKQ